ncbi:GNAT family N-acetyltransferase [Microbacterium tumbae]
MRWATVGDAHGVAVVHVDAWREAYAGLIDQGVLDGLDIERRAEMWASWIARSLDGLPPEGHDHPAHRLLVAERDGAIVGWAGFGAGRDADSAHRGELAGRYAHPSAWSSGIGHALLMRTEEELRAEGWEEACLWGLHGNERAIRFYDRHGWRADGGAKLADAGGATGLHELRHARRLEVIA